MSLRVLEPGLQTLVVDHGRPATRSLGVPVGGAADRFSLALGNGLVGNPPNAPALEIALAGPTLQSDCDLACVLYGAPFDLAHGKGALRAGTTFMLAAEDALHIGSTRAGVRAYLCVQGGIRLPPILGSCSALQPLAVGDVLPCTPGAISSRFVVLSPEWNAEPRTLRALPGPQADWFRADVFFNREYTVTAESSRMGLRLQGEPLPVPGRELVSEPVCPGAVQVTGNGQCIILGVDGQTIGGYPKIAQVVSADIDKLAQLRADDRIRFQQIGREEAIALYRKKQAELNDWLTRLHVAEVFLS
jgi:antagonist of KipI